MFATNRLSSAVAALLVCSFGGVSALQAQPAKKAGAPADVARRLDDALDRAREKNTPVPGRADDVTFLRRVSLDLTGKLPTDEVTRTFFADPDATRRQRLIDRLLTSEGHAVNWGRYWRDVLTYHTSASGNYLKWQFFDAWMVDQVRKNRPWGEVVTDLVTATGINDESGPVNFLTSHFGNPVEIAATTSRVFLGVQLQCAQCHHAKNEPWKREQFHELVAFFGRAKLVQRKDMPARAGSLYAIEGRDDGQYFMTDLKEPTRLIAMQPRLLTGGSVPAEADDLERREALARFLTSPQNPFFAKAHVNRIWTALMGWGFYPGLADLGTEVPARYPEALDILVREWTASGYDMQWLFRTVLATHAYQRQLQARPDADSMTPAPAVCPSRLRPEQIFEALVKALGFDENDKSIPAPAQTSGPAVTRHTGLRHMVYMSFRVDPSLPQEEVQGTIPQALLLMNSALVNSYVAATGKTFLAEALKKNMADDDLVNALYERTLAHRPRPEEMEICRRFVRNVSDRREAFEDIFWSLINSTEFLTKR